MPTTTSPPSAPARLQDLSCFNCNRTMTLADCIPWLEVALEYIDRGPSGLTVDAAERHRRNMMEIVEHIRQTVEREANAAKAH